MPKFSYLGEKSVFFLNNLEWLFVVLTSAYLMWASYRFSKKSRVLAAKYGYRAVKYGKVQVPVPRYDIVALLTLVLITAILFIL